MQCQICCVYCNVVFLQVGKYYKQPRYPIWVVCSESHFSVLFTRSKDFFVRYTTGLLCVHIVIANMHTLYM